MSGSHYFARFCRVTRTKKNIRTRSYCTQDSFATLSRVVKEDNCQSNANWGLSFFPLILPSGPRRFTIFRSTRRASSLESFGVGRTVRNLDTVFAAHRQVVRRKLADDDGDLFPDHCVKVDLLQILPVGHDEVRVQRVLQRQPWRDGKKGQNIYAFRCSTRFKVYKALEALEP